MAVTIVCPRLHCRTILRVPDSVRGQRVRCSQCGTTFLVPARPAPAGKSAPAVPKEDSPKK